MTNDRSRADGQRDVAASTPDTVHVEGSDRQPDDAVEREIRIAAPTEIVFRYFTDPERMARWIGPATLDARPDGMLQVAVAGRHHASGRYLELDPPHRVVFTWGWEQPEYGVPPGSSRIEVDLSPDGAGTVVRLRHVGLGAEHRHEHGEGWMHYLTRLGVAAAGGDPGPDPMAGNVQDVASPVEA